MVSSGLTILGGVGCRSRLTDHLREGNRQAVWIYTNCQLYSFSFSLRRRHDKANPFSLQLFVCSVHVFDVESDRAGSGILRLITTRGLLQNAASMERQRCGAGLELCPVR